MLVSRSISGDPGNEIKMAGGVHVHVVMAALVSIAVLSQLPGSIAAQFADVRCKCVCPKEGKNISKNVFVKEVEPEDCTCEHVVQRAESFCLRCQCKYENRNTALIKGVIIFILVLLGVLFAYKLLLVIDAKRRPVELSVTADEVQQELAQQRRPRAHGVSFRSIDQRVARWKRTVEQQRRNIYDTQSMLN